MIVYAKGYRRQLRCDVRLIVPICPDRPAMTQLVELDCSGKLLIRKYFAWDLCSGPAINTRTNLRACLVHDALYYLMRIGELSIHYRRSVDKHLAEAMIEDGAWRVRADAYFQAVDKYAARYAQVPRKLYHVQHHGEVWTCENSD